MLSLDFSKTAVGPIISQHSVTHCLTYWYSQKYYTDIQITALSTLLQSDCWITARGISNHQYNVCTTLGIRGARQYFLKRVLCALCNSLSMFVLPKLVFKISTSKKQDHFFQATHLEEREAWIKDIKRAITCLQGGRKFARKSTRKSIRLPDTVNLRYETKGAQNL